MPTLGLCNKGYMSTYQEQAKTDFKTRQSRYSKEFKRFDLDNFASNDPYEVLGALDFPGFPRHWLTPKNTPLRT
jgi:hypothetical protein